MPPVEPPSGHEPSPHPHPYPHRPGIGRLALVLVLGAYALFAARTTAFTRGADLATAVPIIAVLMLAVVRWPLAARPLQPGAGAGDHPWRAWVVLFGAAVAWELALYAARGRRADHPTLSSMLDAVDRFYGLKVVVFLLWLALGAAIVWRGGRRPTAEGSAAT